MRPEERPGPRPDPWSRAELSPAEFQRLAAFIQGHCAIRMPPGKRVMVESRLRRRLRALGLGTFREYLAVVFDPAQGPAEQVHLVDAVSTNKTDFFREPEHFDVLVRRALPELARGAGAGIGRPLAVWSAGCSTGEEPYTLAMVLSAVAEGLPGFRFFVLATDISTSVLERASRAVYEHDRIEPIPQALRKKYLLKSRDPARRIVRVAPEVRQQVRFRRLNFMDADFGLREKMDVIFCRNVMIYFDRPTQEGLIRRFCHHLVPGGYLFIGHSETVNGMDVPLEPVVPTVYRTLS